MGKGEGGGEEEEGGRKEGNPFKFPDLLLLLTLGGLEQVQVPAAPSPRGSFS